MVGPRFPTIRKEAREAGQSKPCSTELRVKKKKRVKAIINIIRVKDMNINSCSA